MTSRGKQEPSQHNSVETVETVLAWHNALNQGDVEQVVRLASPNVILGGPRGNTTGAEMVREWVGRANIRLHPLDTYARGESVVVLERGEWLDPSSGQIIGTQMVATAFTVASGLITHIVRHDTLDAALADAGLVQSDRTG